MHIRIPTVSRPGAFSLLDNEQGGPGRPDRSGPEPHSISLWQVAAYLAIAVAACAATVLLQDAGFTFPVLSAGVGP